LIGRSGVNHNFDAIVIAQPSALWSLTGWAYPGWCILIKQYNNLDNIIRIQPDIKIPENYEEIRAIFLNPETIGNYDLKYKELDEAGVYHFLCDQRGFARKNVETIVERMEKFYQDRKQAGLEKWL